VQQEGYLTIRNNQAHAAIGCLLGTAVGDALGLPCEALSKRRQRRLYPQIDGHHFLLGYGMTSDDTEHTCMVAQALITSAGEAGAFARSLAWRLRFWLLGLPAGIGVATLRALLKLWVGFPADRSGVFSAGNGPAMRAAVLGVCYGHDAEKLRTLVRASTRLTHTDPKAEFGALAVALAAHLASKGGDAGLTPLTYYRELRTLLGEEGGELLESIRQACHSVGAGETTESFAAALGLEQGVSGYIFHTVPVVIHAVLSFPRDFRSSVVSAIRCGGDADTTGAITGAIVGAAVGEEGIPREWLEKLAEWPRSVRWMKNLGEQLAEVSQEGKPQAAPRLSPFSLFARNLVFLLVVLLHGFRRLLPPY
jgi:ADP-ribosylglycohydrolase